MANSLAAVRIGHAATGTVVAVTVCHEAPPASSFPDKDDFKPPKQSFVDYDFFFSCAAFIPTNRPVASVSSQDTGGLAQSGAWTEILIPPKI